MTRLPLLLAAGAAALGAAPAAAPAATSRSCSAGQPSALKGHNTNAPVDWDAERMEVDDKADRAVLTGNVIARQGDLTLTAARVTAAYVRNPDVHVERLDASGGVVVRSPSETARGEYGIYDLNRKIITLVGHVTLARCDGTINGGRLVYDLDSGRVVMDASAPSASGQSGRVSGTFSVPRKTGTTGTTGGTGG
jgi:lipopolysaccharide export system protein LptA